MSVDERVLTEQAARIETLLGDIEAIPDAAVRDMVAEVVQGLLMLYGEGLARMLAIIGEQADHGVSSQVLAAFARDDLIAHLLLLHDLHPVDVQTRVARALEEVRPYLQSHGGNVELVEVAGGVARLRLQGSCHGCPSSTMTLKLAIEEAIQKAAPDLDGIEAEGVAEPPPRPAAFVPLSTLRKPAPAAGAPVDASATGPSARAQPLEQAPADAQPAWTAVDGLAGFSDGGLAALEVAGLPLLFCRIEEAFYAYRNACPGCGQSLDRGVLAGTGLACPACGRRYDVRRAGRCLDALDLYLEPVPLLVQDGTVKVALASCES